jgi:hypothetical protein
MNHESNNPYGLITLDNLMAIYNIQIQFNLAKTFIIVLLII